MDNKTGQRTQQEVTVIRRVMTASFGMSHGNVATVTIADVKQSNGVIHVIDTVLLPKM
jgi:uncharacterized surface protein with fasciclin (FAS1) repeats